MSIMTNLPKFLCIGVQKAATSWLWVQLRSHPDVWMPPVKELHFFDHLFVPENRKWTGWHIKTHIGKTIKWHRENGKDSGPYFDYLQGLLAEDMFSEEWYRRAYSLPTTRSKVTGDITPEYCMIDKSGVEYVRSLLGDIKIIIMVRDPVDRALSQIRMNAKNQKIDLASASLDQWMTLAKDPVIYNRARYSEFLPLWRETFGGANMLILRYAEVALQPINLLRRTEQFLGIGSNTYADAHAKIHAGKASDIASPQEVLDLLRQQLARESNYCRDLPTDAVSDSKSKIR
jgi:hypothetical protein